MDKIHQLGVAAPELSQLYPKNSAGIAASGRREAAVTNPDGHFPTRDRGQRLPLDARPVCSLWGELRRKVLPA
jgi:hypothetical protein